MTTKEKWRILREKGPVRVIRSPVLVRLSEGAARFLLAAVLSGVRLPGGYAPLGMAFVGSCGSGADGVCALLGALFGSLCFWGASAGLRDMAGAVLVFSAAFACFDQKVYRKGWFMPAVTAAAAAITGLVTLPAGRVSPAGAAGFLICVLLAGGAVFFDRAALSVRTLAEGETLTRRQKTALLLFSATLLMALDRVRLLNGLSAGRILAAGAALWAGERAGAGAGAVVGLLAGLSMDLAAGESLCAAALGCSGLLAGALRGRGRLCAVLGFVLGNGVLVLWLWEKAEGGGALLYEVFLASVLFAALPERLLRRTAWAAEEAGAAAWARRQSYVKERLEQTAGAFRTVYESLRESFAPGRGDGEEAPFRLFQRAAERVCVRCPLRERCWQAEYQSTAQALNDGLNAMLERGRGQVGDFPVWFTSRCPRFPVFLEAANGELTALLGRRRYQARLRESRMTVCRQYGELSRVLEGAALELSRELAPEPVRERRLNRWLAERAIEGEGCVFYDERGRLRAEIVSRAGEELAAEESRAALSALFGLELRPARVKMQRGKRRVIYTQAEPLSARAGAAAQKKDGEVVSGDAGAWFKGEDGVLWLLLCDGMGSGPAAGRESGLAVRLLERFLRAGVPPEEALRTLNSALALRSEAEGGFTTVDLCKIDLFTGEGSLYKFGAAPTYLKKGDVVVRITGTALPAGLAAGESVEPDATPFALEAGDCLVLLTDGVTDGEEDGWLRQRLRASPGQPPRELARGILEEGAARAASRDDRTVLVVQVEKR